MSSKEVGDEPPLSRRYLAVLAAVAVTILVGGVLLRRTLLDSDAPQSTPPSEAFALQRLSQENQLTDIAAFIGERVHAVSPFVVRRDSAGVTGIRWGSGDSVLTTSRERPVTLLLPLLADTLRPPLPSRADSAELRWLLVVGRDAADHVISAHGMSGGTSSSVCVSKPVEKFVLGLSLPKEFAGGGAFDLSGQLRGMVIACGDDELAVIPITEVARLLSDTTTLVPDSLTADTVAAQRVPQKLQPLPKR